jgi:hypothetical protein
MKLTFHIVALVIGGLASVGRAQLAVESNAAPPCIFPGAGRSISVVFHNAANQNEEAEIHTRLYQTTSATAVLLGDKPWKKLEVLPGQTVLESTPLDFPAIKAETTFVVQWLEGDRVLGRTEITAYPTNLLAELKPLAGEDGVGVYDPNDQLKPTLKNLKVHFENLEDSVLEDFSGRLAIIGPFKSKEQLHEGLASRIRALAKKGAAIVWLQPPPAKRDKLQPSFYSVAVNQRMVVIAQANLVEDLSNSPKPQANLLFLCRLALHPESDHLPFLNPEP